SAQTSGNRERIHPAVVIRLFCRRAGGPRSGRNYRKDRTSGQSRPCRHPGGRSNCRLNNASSLMIENLRQRLPTYVRRDLPMKMPEAAVLMPFTREPDPQLILTVRSVLMPTHAGEVAFPGGKGDAGDSNLLATALRESQEEVGLSPQEVEVLAELTPMASRFGMKVTAF